MRNLKKIGLVLCLSLFLSLGQGCGEQKNGDSAAKSPAVSSPAPVSAKTASPVKDNGRLRIVYFSTANCPACQQMKPVISSLREAIQGKVDFVEGDFKMAPKYGVSFVPTLVIESQSGEVLEMTVGRKSLPVLIQLLKKHGAGL